MQRIKPIKLIPMRLNIDSDKDGVPNWRDCNPWNPNEQGPIHDKLKAVASSAKEKVATIKEQRQTKQVEKAQEQLSGVDARASMTYLIVKIKNGKWENWGAYTTDKIKTVVRDANAMPNVEKVTISKDAKLADKLNRAIMIEQAKKVAKTVGKGAKTLGKGAIGGTVGAVRAVGAPESKGGAREYVKARQFKENIKEGIQIREPRQTYRQQFQPRIYRGYQPQPRTITPNIQIYNYPQSQQEQPRQQPERQQKQYIQDDYEEEKSTNFKPPTKPFSFYKPPIIKL